jgi:hypothetical protein
MLLAQVLRGDGIALGEDWERQLHDELASGPATNAREKRRLGFGWRLPAMVTVSDVGLGWRLPAEDPGRP